jgi:hypothetical protein
MDILMSQIVLDQSRIESLVGQVVAAGMLEHMRPNLERQASALPDLLKQIVDGLARHHAALTYEEMRQMSEFRLSAEPEPGADRAQRISLEGSVPSGARRAFEKKVCISR